MLIEKGTLTKNIPTALHPDEVQGTEEVGLQHQVGHQVRHQGVGPLPPVRPEATHLLRNWTLAGQGVVSRVGLSCLDILR